MNNLSKNVSVMPSTSNGNGRHMTELDSLIDDQDVNKSDMNVVKNCDIIDIESDAPLLSSACKADQMDSDEEETNRIRQNFNDDPGIQSLMEISLPSPIPMVNHDECKTSLFLLHLFLN